VEGGSGCCAQQGDMQHPRNFLHNGCFLTQVDAPLVDFGRPGSLHHFNCRDGNIKRSRFQSPENLQQHDDNGHQ